GRALEAIAARRQAHPRLPWAWPARAAKRCPGTRAWGIMPLAGWTGRSPESRSARGGCQGIYEPGALDHFASPCLFGGDIMRARACARSDRGAETGTSPPAMGMASEGGEEVSGNSSLGHHASRGMDGSITGV